MSKGASTSEGKYNCIIESLTPFIRFVYHVYQPSLMACLWGETLKGDLKKINEYWNSLSDEEKKSYRQKYGDYPPEIANSITNALWEKMCYPREEAVGNPEITPEREKDIMDRMHPMLEAIDKIRQ